MDDVEERNCMIHVSPLARQVTKELLEELFVQTGPVESVIFKPEGSYAMIKFSDAESVPFCIELMDGICLFGIPMRVKPREGSDHARNNKTRGRDRDRVMPPPSPQVRTQSLYNQMAGYGEMPRYPAPAFIPYPPPPPPPQPQRKEFGRSASFHGSERRNRGFRNEEFDRNERRSRSRRY